MKTVDAKHGVVSFQMLAHAVIDRIEVRGTESAKVHSLPATFERDPIDLPDFKIPVLVHGDVPVGTIILISNNVEVGRIINLPSHRPVPKPGPLPRSGAPQLTAVQRAAARKAAADRAKGPAPFLSENQKAPLASTADKKQSL